MAGSNACGVDVAKLPGGQYANKQEDGNANSHAQCQGHLVPFGALPQHEIQRRAQAGKDGKEGNQDKVFHAGHYPVNKVRRFWLLTLAAALAIALTIGLGGLMAYRGTATNRQMLIVPAVFGLVHGLGFAAAVSDRLKDWDNGSIVRILVGFNIGVELAQIAVILMSAAFLWTILHTGLKETKVRRTLCLAVAIVGFGVMAWRVAGIAGLV